MSKTNVAVITGAHKGLGYAIVKSLCSHYNGTVYLTSRDETRGKTACEKLRLLGLSPQFHQLDITDEKSIDCFLKFIKEKHKEIDILINNAGILFLKDASGSKVYQAEQTVFVNFTSLVNFNEKIIPLLKSGGKIINISSSSGHLSRLPSESLRTEFCSLDLNVEELRNLMGSYMDAVNNNIEINNGWGDSPYVVSKIGVNAYTFILHRKLAKEGISVNCVHPGYVKSDMTKGAGSVEPDDAAKLVTKLALENLGSGLYIWHNGTAVPWDGQDPRVYIDGKKA